MKKINYGWCIDNGGREIGTPETQRLVSVLPDERQLEFMKMEYYNFIHFGINTFYNREWGDGEEDISRFRPDKLSTDQWCQVLKATGSKGIIITAKHHDGFCLFDSKYTEHCVRNTPFKRDIVKMLSDSCRKYGLKLGIYLSPWDRHEKTYGTEEYNDYFVNQLTELATNYGDIFCFWFDGACGEGKNGKKQRYDWERYYSTIRKLQPKAVISICGPDVRWIGNEGGKVRESEWSVIPAEKQSVEEVAAASQSDASQTEQMANALKDTDEDLGSRELLKSYERLIFKPAEADVSVNLGWFHSSKPFAYASRPRKAQELADIYWNSVGGNASMLLNVPPDKNGLIGRSELRRLEAFSGIIRSVLDKRLDKLSLGLLTLRGDIREGDSRLEENNEGYTLKKDELGVVISLPRESELIGISLREDLRKGQRIESLDILTEDSQGEYLRVASATVVGSRRIIIFKKKIKTRKLIVLPTCTRAEPCLCDIRIYGQ